MSLPGRKRSSSTHFQRTQGVALLYPGSHMTVHLNKNSRKRLSPLWISHKQSVSFFLWEVNQQLYSKKKCDDWHHPGKKTPTSVDLRGEKEKRSTWLDLRNQAAAVLTQKVCPMTLPMQEHSLSHRFHRSEAGRPAWSGKSGTGSTQFKNLHRDPHRQLNPHLCTLQRGSYTCLTWDIEQPLNSTKFHYSAV